MHKFGRYGKEDRMSELIGGDYRVLLVMSRFGIGIGVGDKSIAEVCGENGVDTETFLAVANLSLGSTLSPEVAKSLSVDSLLSYLHSSHDYFLRFRLPAIRAKLAGIVGQQTELSRAILGYFDEYAGEVRAHMEYEEKTVFPYVRSLQQGAQPGGYTIDVFQKRHDQVEARMSEFKNLMIRFYPAQSTNEVNDVLFDIFNCEQELASHNEIEDGLLIPAIAARETSLKKARR